MNAAARNRVVDARLWLVALSHVVWLGSVFGQTGTATAPQTTQPAGAPAERFLSDEELLKIGQEFDLDAFIEGLDPPTVEEILENLEPILTLEQILDDLKHPERRPKLPTLPEDVSKKVEELDERVEALTQEGALGDDAKAQERALDEAIRLAEQEVELRTEAGQPHDWYEVVNAQDRVATLKHLRMASVADRRALAAAGLRAAEFEELLAGAQYDQAAEVWRRLLAIYSRVLPGDHPYVATGLDNLAQVLHERWASPRAELLVRYALAMRQRLFPGGHPEMGVSLNNLAQILSERGALREAELLHREALTMCWRLFPGDHLHAVAGLNNLAYMLCQRGALAEGELLYRDALAMSRRLIPNDHPYVATSLNNVGFVLQARGELADAEPFYRDALAMNRRLFPGDHHDVAVGLNNVAQNLYDRGALVEAELMARDSLEMYRRLFTGDHPSVALGLNNLAAILHAQGALAEGELLYRDALAMRQRLFTDDHPEVALSLNNLAQVLYNRGVLVEAELRARDSLEMYRRLFPGDHQAVARGLANLAFAVYHRGGLTEAEQLVRDALEMRRRLFPGGHPDWVPSLNDLAGILYRRGALAEAESLYRQAVEMCQRFFPEDHPNMAASLSNLAVTLKAQGALAEAEPLCRDALEMRRRLFPCDHPSVAISLINLASTRYAQGALAQAEMLYHEAFAMSERLRTTIIGGERERALFAGSLRLTGCAHERANVLIQLNRDSEALEMLERGRSRAALDLLERSGRDLMAETAALGDVGRSQRLAAAHAAEEQAQIDLTSTEALLTGRRRERDALERREDLDAEIKARQIAEYDRQIGELFEDVKRKRQVLTRCGNAVLTELRGLFPVARVLTTDEILSGLSSDEAILSFAWGDNSVLVATAAGSKTSAVIVASDKEAVKQLSELAGEVRTALANPPSSRSGLDLAITRELAAGLLPESVCSAVGGARRLIVVPDGPLNDIPLELLAETEPALTDKAIVYAPSATVYMDRVQRARSLAKTAGAPKVVVLGDPIFDRGRREPDYPEEGVLIAAAVKGGNAAKAGLQRGDVLLSYNETKLPNLDALRPAMGAVNDAIESGERKADEPVKVTYWRDGQEADVELPPGRLGVQIQPGDPGGGLRSMALFERGFDAAAAQANALDQVRLFGGSLPRLPGTRVEAEAIAALFRRMSSTSWRSRDGEAPLAATVRLLLGEQATMANLTEQVRGVRYLHLATHGLMGSAAWPYHASLALTQPQEPTPEDIGFLRLQDLMSDWGGRLNHCDLVVLSACDTQRGVRRGDSVMSLPLGFFFAGTPTVVASLWKVDDTATALLMTRFYKNLLGQFEESRQLPDRVYGPAEAMPKGDALREAKLWLRSLTPDRARQAAHRGGLGTIPLREIDYSHPYYWAAFILIGDPG